jgi:hypothetical protein
MVVCRVEAQTNTIHVVSTGVVPMPMATGARVWKDRL